MRRRIRRLSVAAALALPGIGLAMIAKPMRLGEGALLMGFVLAFAIPILWLAAIDLPVPPKASHDEVDRPA